MTLNKFPLTQCGGIYENQFSPKCVNTSAFFISEAYSVAGEIGFGWWLVEHYFSYHVDCLNGCGLGESAMGR